MAAGDIITIIDDPSGRKGNYFDGTDDYVLHDAHAVARVAANDTTGTYSAWIFMENVASTGVILSAGDNDGATEFLKFSVQSSKLQVQITHATTAQFRTYQTTATMQSRKWHHVACVQDGIQPKLYVDGVNVSTTNGSAADLTYWYDELTGCDKFAIGVLETNGTHLEDFKGAIGQVKYWNRALSAAEILQDYNGEALYQDSTYLQFNVTMETDGTTDSGLGADNGTLTGNAHYGSLISPLSYQIEANVTGHAAETLQIIPISPNKHMAVIKRGD